MSKETKNRTFALAFGNLPGNTQELIKKEIMDGCGWKSSQYFSMKKNGARLLSEKEQAQVEFIMRKNGFDAWTGEKL